MEILANGPFKIGYGYNDADQLTQITYPSGRIVQQNYDVLGRLGSIMSGSTTYLSVPVTGGYNAAQMPLALNYGSGVAGAFQYNDHLQMSSLNYALGASTLLNLSYNYLDANGHSNGQIQSITDSRGDAYSTLFAYDPLGRLIQGQTRNLTAANTWNLLWNYDIYGNRESQSAGTPAGTLTTGAPQLDIDPATNRISQSSGFTYDLAGNVTKDPSYTYTYNGEGELVQSVRSSDGMMASDPYDGHRWRMEKTASGATTVYIYSGSKVLAEYVSGAAPNAPSREYVYSGGSLLATLAGTNVTYHYPDHLSNRLETDANGTQVRSFGHLPFGQVWYETGTPDKWKFTGYERDTTESGLDYAMNRMYSNGYGRFETADLLNGTSTNPQSLNRYTYSHNDPSDLSDPSGLAPNSRPIYDVYNPKPFETGWTSLTILELAFTPTALLGYVQTDEAGNVIDVGIAPYYGNWGALGLLNLPSAPAPDSCLPPGVAGPRTAECLAETPPPCGITVRCRGIETKDLGKIGMQHCDAQVTTASGQVHSLSGGPLYNYNGITALQAWDISPPTAPFTGTTVYQGSGCSAAGCLVNSTQQWHNSPVKPIYNPILGPNSNTWLQGTFAACGVSLPINTLGGIW